MANDYFHGIRVTQDAETIYSTPQAGYTPIGVVCTADDATASAFPLNEPVLVSSFGTQKQIQAGTEGTLSTVLSLINSLGDFPPVVVVRVAENEDEALQAAEVVTGLNALATASASLDVEPKIIGAPGLDSDATVIGAMESLCEAVSGFAYVAVTAASSLLAITGKGDLTNRRMMAIWPSFKKDGDEVDPVALALAMRSRIDSTVGPHKSISNVAIPSSSIDSASTAIDWRTEDSTANALNAAHITTIVRRDGNFYFWGSRTCNTADTEWAFESDVRMTDVLNGIIKANQIGNLDSPMTTTQVEDMVENINLDINTAVNNGWLLDGAYAWIDPAENTRSTLENGELYVSYEFTVPKPLEQLGLNSKITNSYLLTVLPSYASEDEDE